jgi:DegV family protein with EDD domain
MLGLAIQRRLERGTTDEEVEALADLHRRESKLIFTLDTLDYLARGGRIGRASAWAGELLKVKPILTIRGGEVVPIKRVRGNRRAFLEFIAALEAGSDDRPELRVAIAHADAPERAAALEEMVRRTRPLAQLELVTTLGPVVGTHAGPGTVGMFWFDDG